MGNKQKIWEPHGGAGTQQILFPLWVASPAFCTSRRTRGAASGARCISPFWVLLAAINGVLAYLFPPLSRFEFKVGGLLSTGVRLAMAHLPSTLLWALGASLLLERIFRPYMEARAPKE